MSEDKIQIEADLSPVRAALRELGELVGELPTSAENIKIIRERLFGNRDNLNEFVSTRTEISGAIGAQRMRIFFEPSDILVQLIAAVRAGEYKFLLFESHTAPPYLPWRRALDGGTLIVELLNDTAKSIEIKAGARR